MRTLKRHLPEHSMSTESANNYGSLEFGRMTRGTVLFILVSLSSCTIAIYQIVDDYLKLYTNDMVAATA